MLDSINEKEAEVFQKLNKLADSGNKVSLPRWATGFPNRVLCSLESKKCLVQVSKNNQTIQYKVNWRIFNKLYAGK